jgi:hypothetical protein
MSLPVRFSTTRSFQNTRVPPSAAFSAWKNFSDDLKIVSGTDMGRIGTIIQRIENLAGDADKAVIAKAVRDKIGPKSFKKHSKREYLESLIRKDEGSA